MTFSTNVLAPSIFLYKDVINFSKIIEHLSCSDKKNWNIGNQNATEWEPGKKIIGYDEYPINFSFSENEHFLILGKKIFDCASNYATKNLTVFDGIDSCVIRKYSPAPGFLEIESSDVDNALRKLTVILFLNSSDQGGELIFNNFDVSISPQEGSAAIFPSSFAYSFKINRPKDSESLVVISHFV